MNKQQQSYFDNHKDVQELHFASDGLPFFVLADATAHANGLPNKTVATINRNEPVDAEEPEATEAPVKHIITQEDLDENPDLVEQGIKVGDEVEFTNQAPPPAADSSEQLTPAQKRAATMAARKAEADKQTK